jgi:hypothetical protein
MKLPFNEKEVIELNEWLAKWDKWRKQKGVGHPDWTGVAIFLMPLTIALLKSATRLTWLTWALIFLTGFLAAERIIWIVRLFQ